MGLTGNNVVVTVNLPRGHLTVWLKQKLQDFCHNFSLFFDILIQSMKSSPNACFDSSLVYSSILSVFPLEGRGLMPSLRKNYLHKPNLLQGK